MSEFKSLSKDQQAKLREFEVEARETARSWIGTFPNDWSGKIRFSMAVAVAVKIMCEITPMLEEDHFVQDVKDGAIIWAECGFISGKEPEAA